MRVDKFIKSSEELVKKMQERETLDIDGCSYRTAEVSYNNTNFYLTMDLIFIGENQEEKVERDFTIDELVFIQEYLEGLRETYIDELVQEEDHRRIKVLQHEVGNITKINKKISELSTTY